MKRKMIECSEECERLRQSLGKKNIFKCSHCKIVTDRDMNAVRNIFIKNL